ncbi:MAG: tetratricopeptide repeat protein, partial [Planctomycetota bacterium]|nr:tetratricopeptide repeat protein [Planctomycetota bacterium]
LGVGDSARQVASKPEPPGATAWRHWLAWFGLAGVVAVLYVTENHRVTGGEIGELEMARAVVKHVPGSVSARNELARTLINENQFDEAMAHADRAIRLEPDVYKSYVYRGVSRIESGRHEQGLADLLEARRRHPRDAYLQYHLAMAKLALGQSEEAVGHLEASREIRPGNPDVHYNLGVIRVQEATSRSDRDLLEIAGKHFREAVKREPSHAQAVCMVGEVDRQMGRTRPAITHFRRSLALDATLAEAHHGLSLALRETQEFEESNRALALAVYHALFQVRGGSGVTGQRIAQALDWAEELQERSGRNHVGSQELLGLARASADQFSRALVAVEAALMSPDAVDPTVRRRLASQARAYRLGQLPPLPPVNAIVP